MRRLLFDVQMNMNTPISDSVSLSEKDWDELKLVAEYRPGLQTVLKYCKLESRLYRLPSNILCLVERKANIFTQVMVK